MRPSRSVVLRALALLVSLGAVQGIFPQRPDPVAEVVRSRAALERIYYEKRIWPAENRGPKPPFEHAVTPAQIRQGALDDLRKVAALVKYWGRPLTPPQMQAEVERMARETKAPERLRLLWAALGSDPRRVAEHLAGPALADRLARNWYAFDERFHGALRAEAARALAAWQAAPAALPLGCEYTETAYALEDAGDAPPDAPLARPDNAIRLPREDWEDLLSSLSTAPAADRGGCAIGTPDAPSGRDAPGNRRDLRAGIPGSLREDEGRFFATLVLESSPGKIRVGVAEWRKVPFDAWWERASRDLPATAPGETTFAYHLPETLACACTDDTWWPLGGTAPAARQYHTAVWTGTEMIVWGGMGSTVLNMGGRFNPAFGTWMATSTLGAPEARASHSAIWTGTEMIIWGGANGSTTVNTGGRYNPSTDSWTATSTTGAPTARYHHTAVWTGTRMVVWGGYQAVNTGGQYDPATDSWTETSLVGVPEARFDHSAVWAPERGEMILWGGSSGSAFLNSGSRYDPESDLWTPISVADAPLPRYDPAAVWTGSKMIVWGGYGCSDPTCSAESALGSGGIYDPAADTWSPTSAAGAPSARTLHTGIWTPFGMIVFGGYGPGGHQNTGGIYDPAGDSWTATSTLNAPEARVEHTAVWTGSEMVVWGGQHGATLNTGGRYNPSSDSWVVTGGTSLPSGRYFHTAVWTGAEMIVWGGVTASGGTGLNNGSRFDPATGSWTPTSTTGAPTGRYGHTAVWTGDEMVVWGAYQQYWYPPLEGGRYNPAIDTWQTISLAGTPSSRGMHTAVWTGGGMLVWGGYGCADPPACFTNGYLGSGGLYHPASDSWEPVAAMGSPRGRVYHSAVYANGRMLVWGGYDGTGFLTHGGSYDPAGGGWMAIPDTPETPSPRANHTAVWDGMRMFVWGGYGEGYCGTGATLNPATWRWKPIPADGSPSGRTYHAAVCAGDRMLVWGGFDGTSLASGGHVRPADGAWIPMTSANAPSARYAHTAIWAQDLEAMIVWGGMPTANNTGGIYCSCTAAPAPPSGPSPPDGSVTCTLPLLAWAPTPGASSYDVWVDGVLRCSDSDGSGCDPGDLEAGNRTWQVVSKNACGSTPGPLWMFDLLGPVPRVGPILAPRPNPGEVQP